MEFTEQFHTIHIFSDIRPHGVHQKGFDFGKITITMETFPDKLSDPFHQYICYTANVLLYPQDWIWHLKQFKHLLSMEISQPLLKKIFFCFFVFWLFFFGGGGGLLFFFIWKHQCYQWERFAWTSLCCFWCLKSQKPSRSIAYNGLLASVLYQGLD